MGSADEEHLIGLVISKFNDSKLHELNRKVTLIGAALLSIIILWILAFYVYERFLNRRVRHTRGAASIHHLTFTVAHGHDRTEPRNTGLDPLLIKALPMFILKKKGPHQKQREDDDNNDDCAVCLSAFDDDEMVRTKVEPRLEPQPPEGPNDLFLHGAPCAIVLVEPIEGTSDVTTIVGPPKIIGTSS
ncbi:unnamed protein product [Lupinus luteus]|uniref:Uncharacterized protein n=1 Tax=Lupinus luteus TaxID=3873 RepID=A0AAV1YG17_LUPLU